MSTEVFWNDATLEKGKYARTIMYTHNSDTCRYHFLSLSVTAFLDRRLWVGDAGCLPLSVDGQRVGEQRSTYKLPLLVRRIVLHFPQRHIV